MGSISLEGVSTLDKIIAGERRIQARCTGCDWSREIPIEEIRDLRDKVGGSFSLIGRRGRCEADGCSGRTRFFFYNALWWPLFTDEDQERWMRLTMR